MNVISNVYAAVTSNAARFSDTDSPRRSVLRRKTHRRIGGRLTHALSYTLFRTTEFRAMPEGRPTEADRVSHQVQEAVQNLAELTAKHVRLTHAIAGWRAEKIRVSFGADRYENLKNNDLAIRGLEGYVSMLIRDNGRPHALILRVSSAITEYRLALSDLLLILDQCFNEAEITEPRTGLIEDNLFSGFSFH